MDIQKTNFSIDNAFIEYLHLVGLDPKKLSIIQLTETRRAFFAGYGMCFRKMEEIGDLDEEHIDMALNLLDDQITKFWKNEK